MRPTPNRTTEPFASPALSRVSPDDLDSVRPSSAEDRALGALVGLAVGDALGTTLEFKPRDAEPEHREMTGGGVFRLRPGQWTDDTAMALALADSLLTCGGLDEADLMTRFLRWYRDGAYSCTGTCFDIGNVTREALLSFADTGEPIAGPSDPFTAGNGSIMRLAPAVLAAGNDVERARDLARRQSRTTHGAPEALDACALFAELLTEAIAGDGKDAVLQPRIFTGAPANTALAAGEWKKKTRGDIRSSGYVVHTLEAALWCVHRTESFEEALVLAVNLADDADTVGAVTGQLAGALYGLSAIPERWLAPLAWRDMIVRTGLALLAQSGAEAKDE